jgi:hypothetical protein
MSPPLLIGTLKLWMDRDRFSLFLGVDVATNINSTGDSEKSITDSEMYSLARSMTNLRSSSFFSTPIESRMRSRLDNFTKVKSSSGPRPTKPSFSTCSIRVLRL